MPIPRAILQHLFPLYSPGTSTHGQGSFSYFPLPARLATGSSPRSPLCFGSQDAILPNLCKKAPEYIPATRTGGSSTLQAITLVTMGSNLTEKPQSNQPKRRKQASPSSLAWLSRQQQMAGKPVPRAAAPARTGQFQHRGPRHERSAHSSAGAQGSWGWPRSSGERVGAGRGPGGLGWRCLLPSHLPYLPPWPRSRPHGFSLPGQAGAQAVSASGKQSSRAGQLHHTWRMRNPRRSGSAAQATATLAAAVHRRLRLPAARARSPGRLVGSLPPPLLLLGTGTSRVRAGAEKPSPCARLGGGRRGQSRGTGASKGVGSAELGAARPPCPGLPGLPTLSPLRRVARPPECTRC